MLVNLYFFHLFKFNFMHTVEEKSYDKGLNIPTLSFQDPNPSNSLSTPLQGRVPAKARGRSSCISRGWHIGNAGISVYNLARRRRFRLDSARGSESLQPRLKRWKRKGGKMPWVSSPTFRYCVPRFFPLRKVNISRESLFLGVTRIPRILSLSRPIPFFLPFHLAVRVTCTACPIKKRVLRCGWKGKIDCVGTERFKSWNRRSGQI